MKQSTSVRSKLWLLLLLLAGSFQAGAQGTSTAVLPPVYVYLDGGLGGGLGSYQQIHLRVEFARHHELSLGYQGFLRRAKRIPADYSPSTFLSAGTYPQDYLDGLGISYGYVLPIAESAGGSVLRASVRAGLVFGRFSRPGNFYHSGNWLGSNYVYDDITQSATGFMIQPGLIATPGRVLGFSGGLYAGFYRDFASFGVYGSVLLGHVSNRIFRRKLPA